MSEEDLGRVPSGTGPLGKAQAPSGLGRSGECPSREDAGMVERVARAILAARGMLLRTSVLPDDALWLGYPKDQAFAEARAAIKAMLEPAAAPDLLTLSERLRSDCFDYSDLAVAADAILRLSAMTPNEEK